MHQIIQALSQPQENGIVIFISGFLIALGLYHLLLFFQNKDKAYLYYALYALTVFVYTYHRANHFILAEWTKTIEPYIVFLYDPIKWIYASIYILFAITFVDFDRHYPNFFRFITRYVKFGFLLLGVLIVITLITNQQKILDFSYNFFFLPIVFLLSLYILWLVYKSKSPVKYYLLIGAGVYLIVTTFSHYLTYTGRPFRVLFYAATAFEMILFALGLGLKQKNILEEKNMWQELIIKEYEENIKLKENLTQELGKEINLKSEQIQQLIKEKQRVEQKKLAIAYSKQILQLRLQAVQAQMNPHFLFNALNSIKNFIIKNNTKQAVLYLTKFAKLIRLVLENAKTSVVSLKDELELMKLYVEVENIRFNNTIDFKIEAEENIDLNKIKVPPMIFQALIENAIWHGLAPKKGDKKLILRVSNESPYIKIEIEDNGIGWKAAQTISMKKRDILKKESMGIRITEERLAVFTQALKNKYKINFIDLYNENNQPAGTKVVIYLPVDQ